jgi:hypothetical protein
MIVIGADTHKRSHVLAAVDEGTGKVRGSREIKAAGGVPAARRDTPAYVSDCSRQVRCGRGFRGSSNPGVWTHLPWTPPFTRKGP